MVTGPSGQGSDGKARCDRHGGRAIDALRCGNEVRSSSLVVVVTNFCGLRSLTGNRVDWICTMIPCLFTNTWSWSRSGRFDSAGLFGVSGCSFS